MRKAGVSKEEIEQIFFLNPGVYADPDHSIGEQRLRAIGRTDLGRALLVAFTIRENADGFRLIRPVSARYMHRKEIDHYEQN